MTNVVANPVLSVALMRSDNLRTCAASTRTLGVTVPRLEGPTEFEVRFDRVDLVEEHYTVETVVWNEEMSIPVAQHLNPTIRIVDEGEPLNRPGIYHPDARFVRITSAGGDVRIEDG